MAQSKGIANKIRSEKPKEKKKRSPEKFKKPNAFLLTLAYCIAAPILKFKYKTTYDKREIKEIQGPALVLCPHVSNIDFILVAVTLFPKRPTFVVSQHFMAKPVIRRLLKLMHVIPKKMFCADIKTIMSILRARESGNIIILFPEGRLPSIGHSLQVTEGTADLVKKMAVDVYTITENGAYKTLPKWGKAGLRAGKMEITTSKLLAAEEIKNMSVSQINHAIEKAIFHDEDKVLTDVYYKCKAPALGLDGILYKCPQCMAEFNMTTDRYNISCDKCGFSAELDNYYTLHGGPFKKINDWYFWQEEQLDLDVPLESETILAVPGEDENMNRNAGHGKIYMDRQTIRFTGECFGEALEFTEKTSDIKAFPMSVGDHFD